MVVPCLHVGSMSLCLGVISQDLTTQVSLSGVGLVIQVPP